MSKQSAAIIAAVLFLFASAAQAEEKKGFFDFMNKRAAPAESYVEQTASEQAQPASDKTEAVVKADTGIVATPSSTLKAKPDNLGAVLQRLVNNNSLSDSDKNALAAVVLNSAPAEADLKDAGYEKVMLLFEQIGNDPNMKVAEKKAALESKIPSAFRELAAAPPAAKELDDKAALLAPDHKKDVLGSGTILPPAPTEDSALTAKTESNKHAFAAGAGIAVKEELPVPPKNNSGVLTQMDPKSKDSKTTKEEA